MPKACAGRREQMRGALLARKRVTLATAAAIALGAAADPPASGAVVPVFQTGGGSGGHLPGSPGGASSGAALTMNNGTATLDPDFDPSTISFPGGSTTAKVGLGRTQSLNSARILFAAGTGVGQTDPGHVQSASTLEFEFSAQWMIPTSTTFGPAIIGSYSVPIAGKISAGGSATFETEVHWDLYNNAIGNFINDARAPYAATQTFTTPGTFTASFTAPASPFSPTSLASVQFGEGDSSLRLRGFIRLTANNELEPSLIEIPTKADFPELAGNTELFQEAYFGYDVVPEPTSAVTLAAAALGLLTARRRRRPRWA
jgi:MYXO-CTERM domain-containing protein